MYDIIVIGAGVTGTCTARELSKYQVNMCVIDKGDDVASGTSKANSGIVHGGYDCKPGTLMAEMNVRGNELLYELAEDLDYPIKKNGSLIVCTVPGERGKLDVLLEQAKENGVPGCRIIDKEEALKMEPNLTDKGTFETKIVVNAAGVYADTLHNMVSEDKKHIIARRGEYLLMDKELGDYFSATVFPLPGKMGKGILCAPTIHGNMFVGPSATDVEGKDAVETTQEILDDLAYKAQHSYLTRTKLPMNKIITSFAGLRAHLPEHEFIIEEAKDAPGFFDALGIESPGLTSSPAIAERIAGQIQDKYHFPEKDNFIAKRKDVIHMEDLTLEEKNALIKEKPEYGSIVCRCEMITEGEIMDAINRPLGARTMDGVKRRTRAGMGRCQAGFCTPRTMEILSRELGIPMTEITKKGEGSNLLVGKIKED